ncbi:MAG: hypothetical protein JEZ03_18135 [Bacteroidales bacterium]|nr:hypothetical protein [Bacteroidales bacterium]
MKNAKADASLYLMTNLLQRLEVSNPGLLKDIISGVKSDQALIPNDAPDKAYLAEIFKESLALLELASLILANDEAA